MTDWLFKHPLVRQLSREGTADTDALEIAQDDVSAAIVDYARNEIERCAGHPPPRCLLCALPCSCADPPRVPVLHPADTS